MKLLLWFAGLTRERTGVKVSWITTPFSTITAILVVSSKNRMTAPFILAADFTLG